MWQGRLERLGLYIISGNRPPVRGRGVEQITEDRSHSQTSRKLLRIKVTPDLHLTYSKNGGNLGLVQKNEKYSLYLNFIDKTCKIYLLIFVLYSIVAFKAKW